MKWLEASIDTSLFGRELLLGALDSIGLTQCQWLETEAEMQNALHENRAQWDYVNETEIAKAGKIMGLRLFFRDDAIGRKQLDLLYALLHDLEKQDFGFDLGSLAVSLLSSEEDDWAQAWKQFYHPFPIGDSLWIKPAWEDAELPKDRVVLEINPGMIFGTGSHATTRLCLEQLEKIVQPGDRLLDLGCGSGILWIAGLLLGAERAVGVDIDPHTEEINRNNAELNHLAPERYEIFVGDMLKDQALVSKIGTGYDIITTNIVADVIMAMLPYMKGFLKEDGLLIASGIIDTRLPEVKQALEEQKWQIKEICSQEGWYMIAANKNKFSLGEK